MLHRDQTLGVLRPESFQVHHLLEVHVETLVEVHHLSLDLGANHLGLSLEVHLEITELNSLGQNLGVNLDLTSEVLRKILVVHSGQALVALLKWTLEAHQDEGLEILIDKTLEVPNGLNSETPQEAVLINQAAEISTEVQDGRITGETAARYGHVLLNLNIV